MSGQNSVMPQFVGGDAEESKMQKFQPIDRKQKLYNTSKNQPPPPEVN